MSAVADNTANVTITAASSSAPGAYYFAVTCGSAISTVAELTVAAAANIAGLMAVRSKVMRFPLQRRFPLFAGSPTGALGKTNGAGTAALFWNPYGITTDGTNLYVTDTSNNEIRQIAIATGVVSLLAGSPDGRFRKCEWNRDCRHVQSAQRHHYRRYQSLRGRLRE